MSNQAWVRSLLLLIMWSVPAIADFEAGLRAYKRGDYATAIKEWRPVAKNGDAQAQYNLGLMYFVGEGVPKDYAQAAKWSYRAAEQGETNGQNVLGYIYLKWHDSEKAMKWFRLAAEQQNRVGQLNLALMYRDGEGVPQDYVQAHMWFNLAASDGGEDAVTGRDQLARLMTPAQIAKAQEMASTWKPTTSLENHPRSNQSKEVVSSGTGFIVSTQVQIMTNYHVVEGCASLVARTSRGREKLNLLAADKNNDFALLGFLKPAPSPLAFSDNLRVKLGQSIHAAGYPLQGLLASSMNLTTGNVSALAGIQDDTRMFQITAPVQPGNSGGPLLDQGGNVVGVITSKLDALRVAKVLGDLPQNINFAVKGSLARAFLDANGVDYLSAPSTALLSTPAIAKKANKAVIVVECWK